MKNKFLVVLLLAILSFAIITGISNFIISNNNIEIIDNIVDNSDPVEEIVEEDIAEEAEEKPSSISIDLLAVGDVMFHTTQIQSAQIGENEYDFNQAFKYVSSYIEEADISMANFETVTVPDREYTGFPNFNSPVETIEALSNAGFDILSTANNHSLDQGRDGIISTIDTIEENGMDYVGTSKEADSPPLILDVEGMKIGFLSYTYGLNGMDVVITSDELSYMVNLIDERRVQDDIESLKEKDVDLIVSYIHWGNEYQMEPLEQQQVLGRNMIEWGVNILLGSHPHVLQRSEVVEFEGKSNYIVYSMGNFLSNQREITMGNSYTEDGVMIKINIEKDLESEETIITNVDYIPTWVYRYGPEGNHSYEILPTEEVINGDLDIDVDDNVMERIEKSYNDVIGVYGE